MNLFCSTPTTKDLIIAEPLYLIFDKHIEDLLNYDLTTEKALWIVNAHGVDACKSFEIAAQIIKWSKEAKLIKNNYEICTNGLTFRIKKQHTNWLGTKTWKWIENHDGIGISEYYDMAQSMLTFDTRLQEFFRKKGIDKRNWAESFAEYF